MGKSIYLEAMPSPPWFLHAPMFDGGGGGGGGVVEGRRVLRRVRRWGMGKCNDNW